MILHADTSNKFNLQISAHSSDHDFPPQINELHNIRIVLALDENIKTVSHFA